MTSAYHHRELEIAQVLGHYELGHLLDHSGLEGFVSMERTALHRSPALPDPDRLRMALEELGPTFVKLGQMLSTRTDLLPPDFQVELAKLQDSADHVPAEVIEQALHAELHAKTVDAFAHFDPEPFAAASIGQVHAATLHDGSEVVVKVRRPGASEEVELDLEILQNMAARVSDRWQNPQQWDLSGLVKDFAEALRGELDYVQEARNAQQFAVNFAADPDVHIPSVHPEFSTSSVITLERIWGTKISDLAELDRAGTDRAAVAERFAQSVAKMVLADGYYHADPHPGNFFVESDGRIGIVDFGRVGRVDDNLRSGLSRLLVALTHQDPDRLTDALLDLRVSTAPVDRGRLRQDLAELLSRYGGEGVEELAIGPAIMDVMEVMRRHNLVISSDLALLFAALVMDESLTAELDPEFRFSRAIMPYVQRHLMSSLSASALARRAEQFGIEVAELVGELPGQLRKILETVGDGQFEVHVRANELEGLVDRVERLGNRVAMTILAAAVIDGLTELTAHQERVSRRLVFGAGIGAVACMGAYTAWRRTTLASFLGKFRTQRPVDHSHVDGSLR